MQRGRIRKQTGIRVIFCDAYCGIKANIIIRFLSRDNDCAGRSASPVNSALWAFKYFDLLQVAIFAIECGRIGVQNAVDQQCKTVLCIARAINATNIDLRIANFSGIHHGDPGSERDKSFRPAHTCSFKYIGGQCRYRAWNVTNALGPAPGSYDDLFDRKDVSCLSVLCHGDA